MKLTYDDAVYSGFSQRLWFMLLNKRQQKWQARRWCELHSRLIAKFELPESGMPPWRKCYSE